MIGDAGAVGGLVEACERGRGEVVGDCAVAEWERNRTYAGYVLIVDVEDNFRDAYMETIRFCAQM